MFDTSKPIVGLAVYDYCSARIASEAGVDFLLVGDSLGMVVLGYDSTKQVTLEDMIRHGGAVQRGSKGSVVVLDMPECSYKTPQDALDSARRIKDETGIDTLKIEGKPEIIEVLVKDGYKLMGHTGLKPQTAQKMAVVGKGEEGHVLLDEARQIQDAGAFALILECIPESLGEIISQSIKIPTIGIGAGRHTGGQILVLNDLLGLIDGKRPKFVRIYDAFYERIDSAVRAFRDDVQKKRYPQEPEIYN